MTLSSNTASGTRAVNWFPKKKKRSRWITFRLESRVSHVSVRRISLSVVSYNYRTTVRWRKSRFFFSRLRNVAFSARNSSRVRSETDRMRTFFCDVLKFFLWFLDDFFLVHFTVFFISFPSIQIATCIFF